MRPDSITIHIDPNSIKIESTYGDRKTVKHTTLESLKAAISQDYKLETPLLPGEWGLQKYVRYGSWELFALSEPPRFTTVKYNLYDNDEEVEDEDFLHFNIPIPPLLWIFTTRTINNDRQLYYSAVFALKSSILTENDLLYRFPFSNVSGTVCWGENDIQLSVNPKSIQSLPHIFFSSPFNSDLDGDKFRPFYDDKYINGYVDDTLSLFRYLHAKSENEKQEEPEFPLSILKVDDFDFKDAINHYAETLQRRRNDEY